VELAQVEFGPQLLRRIRPQLPDAELADLVGECRPGSGDVAVDLADEFGVEIETCVRCGGTLKIIASIEEPEVILSTVCADMEAGALGGMGDMGM
jgi:hypothetical protein